MRPALCCSLFPCLFIFMSGCVSGPHRLASEQPRISIPRRGSANLPGQKSDGSVLLPNQWSLRPAGRQIELDDFPVNIAVHPDGRFAAVLHCGYSQHKISIIDLSSGKVVFKRGIEEAFYGLEFSKDGRKLYCSGAGEEVIHSFNFEKGMLSDHARLKVRPQQERGVPAGLALDSAGRELFVANLWAGRATRIDLTSSVKPVDVSLGTNPEPMLILKTAERLPDFDTA